MPLVLPMESSQEGSAPRGQWRGRRSIMTWSWRKRPRRGGGGRDACAGARSDADIDHVQRVPLHVPLGRQGWLFSERASNRWLARRLDSCSIEACVNNGRECSRHLGSAAAASYASFGRHSDAKCDFSPQVSAKVPLPLSLC